MVHALTTLHTLLLSLAFSHKHKTTHDMLSYLSSLFSVLLPPATTITHTHTNTNAEDSTMAGETIPDTTAATTTAASSNFSPAAATEPSPQTAPQLQAPPQQPSVQDSHILPSTSPSSSPHVIIVGGGIGGLTLSILLERAGIDYIILEKSKEVRLLGSAMALGPGVLPLFEQLGLLKEIWENSKAVRKGVVWTETLVPVMELDHEATKERYGFLTRVIARPKLYEILLNQVPKEKLLMDKKVVRFVDPSAAATVARMDMQASQNDESNDSIEEEEEGVTVYCEDGTEYRGDILVGADGTYSGVRQLLFGQMMDLQALRGSTRGQGEGRSGQLLPESDKHPLVLTSTCLVGQTRPGLSVEQFPFLEGGEGKGGEDDEGGDCTVASVVGVDKPFSWSVFTMKDNSICWLVTEHLQHRRPIPQPLSRSSSSSSLSSSNSSSSSSFSSTSSASKSAKDWNTIQSQKVQSMCHRVKDFRIPASATTATASSASIHFAPPPPSLSSSSSLNTPKRKNPLPRLTLSNLFAVTDRDRISKVSLEEKLFKTWFFGRVVLLGDACHKMNPAAGLGAVAAIQDAAVLADRLFEVFQKGQEGQGKRDEDGKKRKGGVLQRRIQEMAFEPYRRERFPPVKESFETSRQMAHLGKSPEDEEEEYGEEGGESIGRDAYSESDQDEDPYFRRPPPAAVGFGGGLGMMMMGGGSGLGQFIGKVMTHIPKWIWYKVQDKMYECRPQVQFLPRVHDRGQVPPWINPETVPW